jgi:hypothetical protein
LEIRGGRSLLFPEIDEDRANVAEKKGVVKGLEIKIPHINLLSLL